MKHLFLCGFLLCCAFQLSARAPRQTIALTFDDATQSHYSVVAPLLKKYKFGATFYICENKNFNDKHLYMSWDQIKELSDMGFEIGNHSHSHPGMDTLPRKEAIDEIEYIEQKCKEYGIPRPVTFAYPCCRCSDETIEILRERGYRYGRHGGRRIYKPGEKIDSMKIPGCPIFEKNNQTVEVVSRILEECPPGGKIVLCLHGVPDLEHEWVSTTPEHFEQILALLKKHNCRVVALKDL